jgi:hypothetical protein
MSSDTEEDNCPICLNSLTESEVHKTQCGHLFHKKCFDKIIKKECPMCRANLAVAKVITNDNAGVNEIRHASLEERAEERRLINLALAIINRDNTVDNDKLTFILHAAKGSEQFSIDDLLSMLDDDRPYAIRRVASPPSSGNVSPVASPVARSVARTVTKRDPKRVADILKKWKRINPKNSGGKTKKKGQRTHRRKKNTSRSLYTIK